MSRLENTETILAAAEDWKQRCLLEEGSLFSEHSLWTRTNFEELRVLFVDGPDVDPNRSFVEKLEGQLKPGSPNAKCLWAEMAWVYLLIANRQSRKPANKRQLIVDIWNWSGRDFQDAHPLLDDAVLGAGVVHVGQRYNQGWMEYRFFVTSMLAWFSLEPDIRTEYLDRPWECAAWLDSTEFAEGSMFRHALLFLLFPDEFESIISGTAKRNIVKYLHESSGIGSGNLVAVDKALLATRKRIQREYEDGFHFYARPVSELGSATKRRSGSESGSATPVASG